MKLLLKILFSIFALLVIFLVVIFFTPINLIVKEPLQSYGISYENATGNIFSGDFRNVKLANLSINNINFPIKNYLFEKLFSSAEFKSQKYIQMKILIL